MMDYFYLLLTIGVIACSFKGPRWGIAAVAFSLPISRRLPSLPIPLLNTQNLLVVAGLIALLLRPKEPGTSARVRFTIPLAFFLLLVTLAFANTMLAFQPPRFAFSYDPYSVMIAFKNLLTCLLLYALGCMVAKNRKDIETVMKGLMLGAGVEAAFICLEVVVHGPARANGHLFEGNNAGAFLAGSVAIGLALFLHLGWSSRAGRFSLGTSLASAVGLVFTMSRGSWLAAIAAAAGIALIRDRRALVLIVLVLAAYPLWLPEKAIERIDESFVTADRQAPRFRMQGDTDEVRAIGSLQSRLMGGAEEGPGSGQAMRLDSSSQVRLIVWQGALKMIRDYPFGVGYGVFPFYLADYSGVIRFRAAHNSYLLLAAEAGIAALAAFMAFLICLMYESLMAYRAAREPGLKGVGLASLGALVAMMVAAFFYNFFFIIEVNGQQWILLGLATQVRRILRSDPMVEAAPLPAAEGEPVPLYRLVT